MGGVERDNRFGGSIAEEDGLGGSRCVGDGGSGGCFEFSRAESWAWVLM